jgi:hypothetical protein
VRSIPAGIECGATCSAIFDDGASISLVPTPDSGWQFVGWGGGCSDHGQCSVALRSDTTVWATFQPLSPPPVRFAVKVARVGDGSGKVTSNPAGIDCGSACSAQFDGGTTVVLTAAADAGSTFSSWSGACSGPGTCTLSVGGDLSAIASFGRSAPQDDCVGLIPPPVRTPSVVQIDTFRRNQTCSAGSSDGSGNLALIVDDEDQPHGSYVNLFSGSGTALGRYDGMQLSLFAQLEGFEGPNIYGPGLSSDLVAISPRGEVIGSAPRRPVVVWPAEDPRGGVVLVVLSGPQGQQSSVEAYDAKANLRWQIPFPTNDALITFGVDRTGNTLLLMDGSGRYGPRTLTGQWIDHSGQPGVVFKAMEGLNADPRALGFVLLPRVGSGLFLQQPIFLFDYSPGTVRSDWVRQFDSLATGGASPPDWLAARHNTKLHMARGGKAYAMIDLPRLSSPDCSQRIEVIAPSGTSCGSATFTVGSSKCGTSNIDVGYDGTVIQQLPTEMERQSASGTHTCTWRSWTGFFR